MKRQSILLVLVVLGVMVEAAPLFAAMPTTINYQGYLTSAAGTPVKGPVSMTFSLYSSNPARNNPVWTETQQVAVANGIYSAQLGSTAPITAPFDVPYWLGIKVGSDPEMTPLLPMASVPYAFKAYRAGCNPGDMINCYTGPIETLNTGICKGGVRTCGVDGSGFGPCVGQVVPAQVTGCAEPTCSDTVKNGDETDVDCGGSCTSKCATGKACLINADCSSNSCTSGVCAAAPPKKILGNTCLADNECQTGFCVDGYCCNTTCNSTCYTCNQIGHQGTCSPALDGTDPKLQCFGLNCNGAGACQSSLKVNGNTCVANNECQSGFCVDGVCCNTACNGTCNTCGPLSGHTGTCGFVPAGLDPKGQCLGSSCSGIGACQ